MKIGLMLIFVATLSYAQAPATSWQLQQLIQKSEQQIELLKEVLKTSQQDAQIMTRVSQALDELTRGIDSSIQKFQGTPEFLEAMNSLQAERYRVSTRQMKDHRGEGVEARFTDQSLRANVEDLKIQMKLQETLSAAPPGFVSKIHAEGQLGAWQTATRISAQLAELIEISRAIRDELEAQKRHANAISLFNHLVKSADVQNEQLRTRVQP